MSLNFSDSKDLLFQDLTPFIEKELGKTEWVTIFELFDKKYPSVDRGTFFCALVPNNLKTECLKKPDWDLLIGNGKPGFITSYQEGKEQTKYYRFGDCNGIEPFVYWRSFRNRKTSVIDISEEFRFYFDLFEIHQDDKRFFIYTDEDGNEFEVLKITVDKVEVRLKFLKEFLAVRKMDMAVYFDVMRFLPETLEELGVEHIERYPIHQTTILS